jgi:hypothetical protein
VHTENGLYYKLKYVAQVLKRHKMFSTVVVVVVAAAAVAAAVVVVV